VFNYWCLLAGILFIAATGLLNGRFVDVRGPLAIAIVVATIAALTASVIAYLRFLRETDELLRKIQIDALGAGFGAGTIFMLGYRLCERIGAPKLDVDDGFLVMLVFWVIGQYVGYRRFIRSEVEA
jgi:hypothetical protein